MAADDLVTEGQVGSLTAAVAEAVSLRDYTYRQSTEPVSPALNETWYDTGSFVASVWADPGDGADWFQIEGATNVQPPTWVPITQYDYNLIAPGVPGVLYLILAD